MVESEALKGFNNKPDMFTVSSFPVHRTCKRISNRWCLRKIGEVVKYDESFQLDRRSLHTYNAIHVKNPGFFNIPGFPGRALFFSWG